MSGYPLLKAIHVGAVALSGLGFFARGLGRLADARWMRSTAARVLPHAVDTVLLASALALAWTLRLSPLHSAWLAAKIAGLCAYIALGLVAFRFAATARMRLASWLAALLVFGYIVSVAALKNPLGFLSLAA
jgi:uncharacterized membrane protein SirB2